MPARAKQRPRPKGAGLRRAPVAAPARLPAETNGLQIVDLGGGETLAFTERGEGPPIVLVHGALVTHSDWPEAMLDALARHGRVIALDRPGHGASLRRPQSGSPKRQAILIAEGLRQIGAERPLLIGHSFGAITCLHLAQMIKTAGLVLLAPVCLPEFRPIEHTWLAPRAAPAAGAAFVRVLSASDHLMLAIAQSAMFAPAAPPTDWLAAYPFDQILSADNMRAEGEDAAAMHPFSLSAYVNFTKVRTPALIVSGRLDMVARPERQSDIARVWLPQARVAHLPLAGHMLQHTDTAQVLNLIESAFF